MKSDSKPPRPSRGPGRPPNTTPTSTVSIRVPVSVHDRLIQLANKRNTTVSREGARIIILGLPQ